MFPPMRPLPFGYQANERILRLQRVGKTTRKIAVVNILLRNIANIRDGDSEIVLSSQ